MRVLALGVLLLMSAVVVAACGGGGNDSGGTGAADPAASPTAAEVDAGEAAASPTAAAGFDAGDRERAAARLVGLLGIAQEGRTTSNAMTEVRGLIASARLLEICESRELHESLSPGCEMSVEAGAASAIASGPIYADAFSALYEVVPEGDALIINEDNAHDADLLAIEGVRADVADVFRRLETSLRANPSDSSGAVLEAGLVLTLVCSPSVLSRLSAISTLDLSAEDLQLAVTCLATLDVLSEMTNYRREETSDGRALRAGQILDLLSDLGL